MEHLCLLILLSNLIYFSISLNLIIASDSLTPSESLKDGDTLVSEGEVFEMGFFSPANHSNNKYLGIWYKSNPALVFWVANRNYPLSDSNGTFTVNNQGNLLILNQMRRVIWSSSNESRVTKNPVAQILDSGNLVVRDGRSSDIYLWQSFDHPTDTLFAGTKLGWDLNTGLERCLTSWKSSDDPSIGEFTYRINITAGLPQLILYQGSTRKFRTGPWNGVRFSGISTFENRGFKPFFVVNENEYYYFFGVSDSSVSSRITMNISGLAQLLILHNKSSTQWNVMYTVPYEKCDGYGFCGDNGVCKISSDPVCECLEGFKPRSQGEWEMLNWSNGCVRKLPLDCHKGEDFVEIKMVKLPDLLEFSMKKNTSLKECKEMCLKNCSCTACASLDIGGGSGCLMWFGDLIDVRELSSNEYEQDIYVRLAASEIKSIRHENRKKTVKIIVALTISGLCILGLPMLLWCIIRKTITKVTGSKTKKEDIDIPLFDFDTIATVTNNFSPTCVIGEGGFGPVYKGILSTGKDVAIKRLSKSSGQGVEEFKNEIVLIAKLQHRNLVGLIGCCIKDEERMLIYEYMSNNSLNHFIFDHKKSPLLEWGKRYDIILGIARGLLYLHEDSKLQIIHRDLKLSNILLDSNMNPKISDFGLARIFGGNERETKTKRVVGTYGYMSPEYAVDGKISKKGDVFSFGVVLLEIISGKRNRFFSHPDHYHNLLGHAWLLWSEGRALELLDSCLISSCVESQVLRCIQVGLLCVQKLSVDRPTMASVVFMLANEEARLPQPKQPGFFEERSAIGDFESTREELTTKNEITLTLFDGR